MKMLYNAAFVQADACVQKADCLKTTANTVWVCSLLHVHVIIRIHLFEKIPLINGVSISIDSNFDVEQLSTANICCIFMQHGAKMNKELM